jgi:hypothetical protein
MGVYDGLARPIGKEKTHTIRISTVVGPSPAAAVGLPPLDINLIEKAWRARDGAGHALLTRGLPADADKTHRDATNRYFGSILHHAQLPKNAEPFDEEVNPSASAKHQGKRRIVVASAHLFFR